jgi:hypothetical protein
MASLAEELVLEDSYSRRTNSRCLPGDGGPARPRKIHALVVRRPCRQRHVSRAFDSRSRDKHGHPELGNMCVIAYVARAVP